MNNQDGFGIVEFIVALGIFLIIGVSGVTSVVGSFSSNRLGDEETQAAIYAQQGLEAARSIKNQGWNIPLLATDCTGTCGVGILGGTWAWSGTGNTSGKFNRTIKVSNVQRDGSNTIVTSGGTNDIDTKKITSTVTWSFSPTRNNTIALDTYVTNFRKLMGGLLFYSDGTTIPKYRLYANGTGVAYGAEISGFNSASGQTFVVRTSPSKTEAIAGFVTSAGVLHIHCFNGTNWSSEWTATVGGTGTTRRFDISYETNTGDAVVLYSQNVATTNELAYRTKAGTTGCGSANWTAATNLNPVRTSGTIQWVKLAWDRRSSSNLIAAIWADSASDLSAMVWSGSAWGNEPTAVTEAALEVVTAAQDVEDFDVEYESLSGDVMIVWANSTGANGTNGVRYRTCTGGISSCSWTAVTTPPTFADDATNLDISANPNTDQIQFASVGNAGSDLQTGLWSGSAWTDTANVDATSGTPVAGSKIVATGWLISGATTRSVVVYNDSGTTNVGWYVCNGSTCTVQADFTPAPAFANPQRYYSIEMNPIVKDNLQLNVSDNSNDLFGKRLVMTAVPAFTWTNADGAALETTLPQSINSPFSFAFWRN